MLLVAIAMVAHTLRYQSQLITGLAFLLAFSTVALSQDNVYSLVAGVVLASVAITLERTTGSRSLVPESIQRKVGVAAKLNATQDQG